MIHFNNMDECDEYRSKRCPDCPDCSCEEDKLKEDEGEVVDEGCGCCGYCFKCAQGYAKAEMAYFDAAFDYERRWGIKCPQN